MISAKGYFCVMEKQIVRIFSLEIMEPGTFISDIIMAVACFFFFRNLKKVSVTKFHKHLSHYFLFMALSSFVGAFAHGFYLYTGKFLHFITWMLTGIAIYFIEYGVSTNLKKQERFINFSKIQLVVYVLLTTYFLDFTVVKINTALGLLGIVVPILIVRILKFDEKYYIYSILGISLAIVPALMHQVKFAFGGIFNMNDLSHFVLILCQFLLFKGFRNSVTNGKFLFAEAKF